MSIETNILEAAKNLFIQFGMRSVTMDDIAKEVGVSKKTIYQHFKDKDSIVEESVKAHFNAHLEEIKLSLEEFNEPVRQLLSISNCIMHQMDSANPVLLHDIQRYYPKAYKTLTEFKGVLFEHMVSILESGIESGVIRNDLDSKIIATMRLYQVESVFDASIYPRDQFNFIIVQQQLLKLFINGILTDNGRELIKNYTNEI